MTNPLTITEFARMGGKARAKKLGKARLAESARKAAQARWAEHKRAMKQIDKELDKLEKTTERIGEMAAKLPKPKRARKTKKGTPC